MRKIWALGLIGLIVGGCNVDTDGDGLSNRGERQFGTDPQIVDTDGDGLNDYEEWGLGTNGTEADTDDDGYTDWEEIEGGTDPNDNDSVIYRGGRSITPSIKMNQKIMFILAQNNLSLAIGCRASF